MAYCVFSEQNIYESTKFKLLWHLKHHISQLFTTVRLHKAKAQSLILWKLHFSQLFWCMHKLLMQLDGGDLQWKQHTLPEEPTHQH